MRDELVYFSRMTNEYFYGLLECGSKINHNPPVNAAVVNKTGKKYESAENSFHAAMKILKPACEYVTALFGTPYDIIFRCKGNADVEGENIRKELSKSGYEFSLQMLKVNSFEGDFAHNGYSLAHILVNVHTGTKRLGKKELAGAQFVCYTYGVHDLVVGVPFKSISGLEEIVDTIIKFGRVERTTTLLPSMTA